MQDGKVRVPKGSHGQKRQHPDGGLDRGFCLRISTEACQGLLDPALLRLQFQSADPALEEDSEANSTDFQSSEKEDCAGAPGGGVGRGPGLGPNSLLMLVSRRSRACPKPWDPGE